MPIGHLPVDRIPPIRFPQGMNENNAYEMSPRVRQRLRRKLKTWYDREARELPWRETHDPYRVWISEIMLQQTTVAAVIPYYERFFQAFPTLESLATGEEEQVLKLWEGLGYYSRARNIFKAAREIWENRKGVFPSRVSDLQTLPGIGRYTAGAIASFAYDRKAPIVEANTLRLYSRLLGYPDDPRGSVGQRVLWQFAEDILPQKTPGRFNQALMELGSRICTPREPDCAGCPVQHECRAFAEGTQTQIPRRSEPVPLTDVTEVSIAVQKGDCYLLRQRGEKERWAGLWDFPRYEVDSHAVILAGSSRQSSRSKSRLLEPRLERLAQQQLEKQLFEQTGIQAELQNLATEFRHGVTRFRIHLLCFHGRFVFGSPLKSNTIRWVSVRELSDYPLSTTGRKFADWLADAP